MSNVSQAKAVTIQLRNELIEVIVSPERGADITHLKDLRSEIQVFAESPTRFVTNTSAGWANSMTNWISGYPGGWQILIPNAGPEREWDGVMQGFHGEASLARWNILDRSETSAVMETFLLAAPLRIHREVLLEAHTLRVVDSVTNLSSKETYFRFCQHPAFGSHFLDSESYITTSAGRFLADAENPGTLIRANSTGSPSEVFPKNPILDAIALPGPGSGENLFGALTEFRSLTGLDPITTVSFVSPNKNLMANLSWNKDVFPHAWFWIEANAISEWPWFGRLFAVAVEPSNILPGEGPGPAGLTRGGPGIAVPSGATVTSEVTIELLQPSQSDALKKLKN